MILTKKASVILTLAIAAAVALVSSHPAAAQSIKGPSTAAVNQEVRLVVEELKTPEISKAAEWAQKLRLDVSGPDGSQWLADPELTIGLGSGGLKLRVYFSADKPGVYVLVLLDANTSGLALHRITVGGVTPTPPDPTPPPVVTPPVAGLRTLYLIHETGDTTPQLASIVAQLRAGEPAKYLTSKQHGLRILDDESLAEAKATSPVLAQWLAKVEGKPLPCLLIADTSRQDASGVLFVDKLPASAQAVIDVLKQYGG